MLCTFLAVLGISDWREDLQKLSRDAERCKNDFCRPRRVKALSRDWTPNPSDSHKFRSWSSAIVIRCNSQDPAENGPPKVEGSQTELGGIMRVEKSRERESS